MKSRERAISSKYPPKTAQNDDLEVGEEYFGMNPKIVQEMIWKMWLSSKN